MPNHSLLVSPLKFFPSQRFRTSEHYDTDVALYTWRQESRDFNTYMAITGQLFGSKVVLLVFLKPQTDQEVPIHFVISPLNLFVWSIGFIISYTYSVQILYPKSNSLEEEIASKKTICGGQSDKSNRNVLQYDTSSSPNIKFSPSGFGGALKEFEARE